MPTYDYQCAGCGHEFEAIQSISGDRLKKCPKCGKAKLQRLIGSGSGIIFKGSGFYQTDYKNKGSGASGGKGEASGGAAKDKKQSKPSSAPPAGSGGCGTGCGCH